MLTAEGIRVAVVGGRERAALTESYFRGFQEIGCDVCLIDYYGHLRRSLSPVLYSHGPTRRVAEEAVRPLVEVMTLRELSQFKPQLVFIVKSDCLHKRWYERVRVNTGASMAAYHPDDPFDTGNFLRPAAAHWRALTQMRMVDSYYIWSHRIAARCTHEGVQNVHYLPFACDPLIHYPISISIDEQRTFGADVSFIGNWDEKREHWLSYFEHSGLELGVWGTDYWRTRCRNRFVRRAWRGSPAVGDDFCRVVGASKVSLNILRKQNKGAHNMRTFEIPACGGRMLAEWSSDQIQYFRPGIEAAYESDPTSLVHTARALVKLSELEGSRMAEAALSRAREHTYSRRCRTILDSMALLGGY